MHRVADAASLVVQIMDAITLLKNDHLTVEKLFKRFEKTGDGAHVERRRIVDQIIEELSMALLRRWQSGRGAATVGLDRVSDCSCEFVERGCGGEPG